MGFLHSFTTGSAVDGPGVRVVAWTTGCMWRCLYCHNPDTWKLRNGIPVSVAQAAAKLRDYRHGLRIMSGGFTLSGGEPLLQHRFAAKLLAAAKGMGIHTTIETNGYFGDRLSDAELGDHRPGDARAQDVGPGSPPGAHRRRDRPDARRSPRRLAALRKPVWIRFVLVPGLTDDPDDMAGSAAFAASLGNVERVEVLPFHQMGRYKWERLGLEYTLADVSPPTPDAVRAGVRRVARRRAQRELRTWTGLPQLP